MDSPPFFYKLAALNLKNKCDSIITDNEISLSKALKTLSYMKITRQARKEIISELEKMGLIKKSHRDKDGWVILINGNLEKRPGHR